eukprot:2814401-Prymnesium_polylepis.1
MSGQWFFGPLSKVAVHQVRAHPPCSSPRHEYPVRSMENATSPRHSGQDGVKLVPMSTTLPS